MLGTRQDHEASKEVQEKFIVSGFGFVTFFASCE
jgi:hypothetical protein